MKDTHSGGLSSVLKSLHEPHSKMLYPHPEKVGRFKL